MRLSCQRFLYIFLLTCLCTLIAGAQRNYKPASVLSSGNWLKISASTAGVYKVDGSFLASFAALPLPSSQLRLFGSGGGMLPEANSANRPDDLEEVAIQVVDGGDGQFDSKDYFLFYAPGPHHWKMDSSSGQFRHEKNLYSEKAFYFLTIGGSGKRIAQQQAIGTSPIIVSSFDDRYFHELDTVNFLSSGKQWFGETFADGPGSNSSKIFSLPLNGVVPGSGATVVTRLAARSAGVGAGFKIAINDIEVQQTTIPPVGTGFYDVFARETEQRSGFVATGMEKITCSFVPGSFNSQGWLNWFEIFCRRYLSFSGTNTLLFRDNNSLHNGNITFVISDAPSSALVWDVSNAATPILINSSFANGEIRFTNNTDIVREYVCFGSQTMIPTNEGRVAPQNLHASTPTDYFIITPPAFLAEAEHLAAFHRQHDGLRTKVVTTEQVYNEFASGTPDPVAIRDFVKMYYDKYKDTWSQSGKYLLLFGKASFDYKNRIANNTSLVPAYESANSLDPLATYTSDDFFGFLDDDEDINSGIVKNLLDIGIGRVPATNKEEAANFVKKVLDYHAPQAFGPWRNRLNFIADDEDQNLHLQDAEVLTATVEGTAPVFNTQKIYLDAFQQQDGSAGGRYPQVNTSINSNIYKGTLIWNYSGHGGPQRLAEEVVLDQTIVNNWNNRYRLPLVITATCDFAPYDNPLVNSLGENLLIRPNTGAIALMTTTRVVFAFSNRIMNNNYLKTALQPDATGKYKTLGEAVQQAKNITYSTSGDIINNRKFALLGDPAMTLGFPENKVVITEVNGQNANVTDTVRATDRVEMKGHVQNQSGSVLNQFNGTAYLTFFDKPEVISTIGNDATSQPISFKEQNNVLFQGKATVTNGQFAFAFKMPKDINYQYGQGKISLYANSQQQDANGFTNNIIVGGIGSAIDNDKEGPEVQAYLNDEKFVNGSIVNSNPILLLKLSDSSGINTGSAGIDHDIAATLDNNNNTYFVLNNYYESEADNYQNGTVRFQLPAMEPGHHTLHIKAWDVMNNSGEYVLNFTVVADENLRIDHVLNYPNPFTTNTSFWFEHNQPGIDLNTRVEIYTISGKLIKTLSRTINTAGNRSSEIVWNGIDEFGNKLGRGVYLYCLRVTSFNGKTATQWQRLVVL